MALHQKVEHKFLDQILIRQVERDQQGIFEQQYARQD